MATQKLVAQQSHASSVFEVHPQVLQTSDRIYRLPLLDQLPFEILETYRGKFLSMMVFFEIFYRKCYYSLPIVLRDVLSLILESSWSLVAFFFLVVILRDLGELLSENGLGFFGQWKPVLFCILTLNLFGFWFRTSNIIFEGDPSVGLKWIIFRLTVGRKEDFVK